MSLRLVSRAAPLDRTSVEAPQEDDSNAAVVPKESKAKKSKAKKPQAKRTSKST